MTALAAAMLVSPVFAAPAVPVKADAAAAAADNIKVNLNKADAKALMQIKGMTAYKAHAIVAYRNKNGEFKNTAELEKVRGFKRMKPEEIKPLSDHLVLE